MMEVSRRLIEHNGALEPGSELGLVYYMTAGENPIYAGSAGVAAKLTATSVQHTFPMPFHLFRPLFTQGAHCITPSVRHWPPQSVSSKIKHRNRLHMWIGDQEAKLGDPDAIAIYLDTNGNVSETGGSNFVIYRNGQVVSPRRTNVLWGISVTVLAEILAELDIPFVEDDIQPYDVINADEAWLPTTPYCLAPVVRFNGRPVGDGNPGPVWRRILDHWSQKVGTDIYAQVVDAVDPSA
jgi:branched-chain amino acid aminotransferase